MTIKTITNTLIFSLIIVGCSSNPSSEKLSSEGKSNQSKEQVPTKASSTKSKKKHRHPPLPNGEISVDIIHQDNRFHLLTGRHENGKKSLWYQTSSDQEIQWSTPVKVNQQEHGALSVTRGNDAKFAIQDNNLIAVWTSHSDSNRHGAGPMAISRSNDGGLTWQAGKVPADWNEGPHAFFALAGDQQSIRVVWLDSRFGPSEVKGSQGLRYSYTSDGGRTWSINQTMDNVTCACCWNTAKPGPNGELYVLYRDKQPTDMALGIIDQQHQWTRQNSVGDFKWNFAGCPHIGGGLDFQANKQSQSILHSVVGTGHPEHLGFYYVQSADNGISWKPPIQLGDESALHGDVAVSDDDRVVAVWDMMTEDDRQLAIFMAESKDLGANWSEPKQISKPGIRASHPRIVAKNNGFLTLWTESKDGLTQSLQTYQQ